MREELIGVFGLSWQEQIAKDLYNVYTDKELKSLLGWNTSLINRIESAYKVGKTNGLSGTSLATYIKTIVTLSKPAIIDTYVKIRENYSGSSFSNAVTAVTNPIIKTAGSTVSAVSKPLTGIVLGVAAIAVIGFIIYTKKGKK